MQYLHSARYYVYYPKMFVNNNSARKIFATNPALILQSDIEKDKNMLRTLENAKLQAMTTGAELT